MNQTKSFIQAIASFIEMPSHCPKDLNIAEIKKLNEFDDISLLKLSENEYDDYNLESTYKMN